MKGSVNFLIKTLALLFFHFVYIQSMYIQLGELNFKENLNSNQLYLFQAIGFPLWFYVLTFSSFNTFFYNSNIYTHRYNVWLENGVSVCVRVYVSFLMMTIIHNRAQVIHFTALIGNFLLRLYHAKNALKINDITLRFIYTAKSFLDWRFSLVDSSERISLSLFSIQSSWSVEDIFFFHFFLCLSL